VAGFSAEGSHFVGGALYEVAKVERWVIAPGSACALEYRRTYLRR